MIAVRYPVYLHYQHKIYKFTASLVALDLFVGVVHYRVLKFNDI